MPGQGKGSEAGGNWESLRKKGQRRWLVSDTLGPLQFPGPPAALHQGCSVHSVGAVAGCNHARMRGIKKEGTLKFVHLIVCIPVKKFFKKNMQKKQ